MTASLLDGATGGTRGLSGCLRASFHATDQGVRVVREVSAPPLELRGPFLTDLQGRSRFLLRNVTAGVFGGDTLALDLCARRGVSVSLAPTAATRVYESRGEVAHVATRLLVEGGACVDFDGGVTILQQGSELEQDVALEVTEGGRLVYTDTLVVGRIAHQERLAFRRLSAALAVVADGRPLFDEHVVLAPSRHRSEIEAALGGAHALGTMLIVGLPFPEALASTLGACPGVVAGASGLPGGGGMIVRALARSPEAITRLFGATRTLLAGTDTSVDTQGQRASS